MQTHTTQSSASQSETAENITITVALGDGIGPEITQATLRILAAAGARITPEFIDIGERVYLAGHSSGIHPAAWDTLRRNKVFLKGPITTPSGSGYKSLNVTIRKSLGLYANVRPCISYAPFVSTLHPSMDVVIIRENEEDLYAGIEHRQTDEVYQCLKLITRPGCEKIIRYAFEYARSHGRQKVTCMVKDNIMKMTDGLFYKVFQEIAPDYPDIKTERLIIDIGSAKLATRPAQFDVIVTLNLYGDIISDIAAEMTGSVGLAGSANIGDYVAMFEAIHGSAPDIAGQGIANPSGMILSAVMMLIHLRQADIATQIHNAWLSTIEEGIHTSDLQGSQSQQIVGTAAFAEAVIARLGQTPKTFTPMLYQNPAPNVAYQAPKADAIRNITPLVKKMVGVDIFIHQHYLSPQQLASRLTALSTPALVLEMITNRGVKVWPEGFPETFCTDHWRCRFTHPTQQNIDHKDIMQLLVKLTDCGIDVIKTENLCTFNGEIGFALGQGQ